MAWNISLDPHPFWCTAIIFTHADGHFFISPVLVHQSNNYTQYIHHNIPNGWEFHNSPSGYMDYVGWLKPMDNLSSMCCSSSLNTQVLLYGGHSRNFNDRLLNILWSHHIHYFILKAGDSVHDHPNNNGPNLKLNNLNGDTIMNWTRKHWTLKFTTAHMNYVLVET